MSLFEAEVGPVPDWLISEFKFALVIRTQLSTYSTRNKRVRHLQYRIIGITIRFIISLFVIIKLLKLFNKQN